jgi:hypothetical protein
MIYTIIGLVFIEAALALSFYLQTGQAIQFNISGLIQLLTLFAVALSAFFGVKAGLNGVKKDVKIIKESQAKDLTIIQEDISEIKKSDDYQNKCLAEHHGRICTLEAELHKTKQST